LGKSSPARRSVLVHRRDQLVGGPRCLGSGTRTTCADHQWVTVDCRDNPHDSSGPHTQPDPGSNARTDYAHGDTGSETCPSHAYVNAGSNSYGNAGSDSGYGNDTGAGAKAPLEHGRVGVKLVEVENFFEG
jgi:hypothetical protein